MVFWFVLGIIALIWVIYVIYGFTSRNGYAWSDGANNAGYVTLAVGIIGVFVVLFGSIGSRTTTTELHATYDLRALVTEEDTVSGTEAVFFLGFGYASSGSDEVTTISYIQTADDGGNTLRETSIDQAVIYEDANGDVTPYVEDWATVYTYNNTFWPWPAGPNVVVNEHRFHIPEGSIYQGYSVTP